MIYKVETATAHIVGKELKCTVNYFGAPLVMSLYTIVFAPTVVHMEILLPLMQDPYFRKKDCYLVCFLRNRWRI